MQYERHHLTENKIAGELPVAYSVCAGYLGVCWHSRWDWRLLRPYFLSQHF